MTDRELVERAKQGGQDAFERLVLDNQNRVYSLALRLCGDREEAADLAQEAFVKAWQGLASFQGESSFSTWVYRLTTNVCIDHLRKKKRRETVEPAVSLDDQDSGWAEPADWEQDPQRLLEKSERGKALARGLDKLPDWQRQALMLRELSGLSYQEIGQALNIDLGTVKSRIARARLSLRKILLEDGNFLTPRRLNQQRTKREGVKPVDCDKYLELLSLRLDGELTQAEERELEAHLAVCPACRAVGAQLSALQDALGDWEDAEVPEGFTQSVMGRIREEESRPKVIPLFRRPQFRALAGLAACLALAVGLYGVSHPTDGGGAAPSAVETLQDAGPLAGSAPVERCMPELEDDAPMAAAYCDPEDSLLYGAQKSVPDAAGAYDGVAAAPAVSPAVLTLDRMPEGAWELIPLRTSVPSEGLLVTKELFEEIDRLAQEEEITASITTGWKDAEEFIIVVLEEIK